MATPQSKFPRFPDGDVLVTFPDGRVYQLHAVVLRRNSTKLADLLAKDNGAALTAQSKKNGAVIRYRIDLVVSGDKSAEYVSRVCIQYERMRNIVGQKVNQEIKCIGSR